MAFTRTTALALALSALAALTTLSACTQMPQRHAAPGCAEDAQDLPTRALYGQWQARIDGQIEPARVELRRHPEYDGVRGTITRPGKAPALLAGDVDPADGKLTLDESQDGRSISASWIGALQAESCGRKFTGTWHDNTADKDHAFTLERASPNPPK
ncbi:hypothetical protein QTH91_21400 [Variovorax dokdonensis]|uniref:Lipoprotein n=1 Tax=Variovorax dokdonensis TaxID=344883 RepID=A0ABT7NGM6_9BURK|nr:hypothetical protein [Variovorax dokdonensis]MDM0047062.1 hypothetical protein [Variovorax dokdonensis]